MKALIFALATALPQFSTDQNNIAQHIINLCQLRDHSAKSIESLFLKTGIAKRYSVLKDFQSPLEEATLFNKNFLEFVPGTQQRNDIYIKEAPKLALAAAQKAITMWGRPAQEITHIISVSCTGVMAPGIEFILQNELGMRDDVQRLGINFMGCFGAFKGLAIATAIAKENPSTRVLVVCTELCTLHFQISVKPEVLVGNALFADGSAAVIIGCNKLPEENSLWSIEKSGSCALKNSQDKMTWVASNHGLVMTLARDVPKIIETEAPKAISKFLENIDYKNLIWAIHPGGKAIVEAIEHSYNLNKEQTASSWEVLKNYGNMSSATFLFVLDDLLKNKQHNKDTVGIGFGPGLSLEMILLGTN
ncbi:MAG: type III polyketide synthase [Candidatus Babeliales bacterium]|nr:type III polyketide synthase [Candidatus Babeliales bacterium]